MFVSSFMPEQENLQFNLPPTFATVEEHREHLKQRVAGACRVFGRLGFTEGVAGHISARDPEYPDAFWVNPFGMSFRQIRVSDLILVDHAGVVRHGRRPVNRAGFVIHSAIHRARPDVVAVCHAHAIHGKAWSSLGRLLDPITQDACVIYEDHVVVTEDAGAVAVDESAGKALASGLGEAKAAIHQNHGIFTVGQSVDEAAWWFMSMERSAQAQLMAEAVGTPKLIDPAAARHTRAETGFPLAGWVSFQPHWDEVVRSDPDLFD